jgi:hypothetical protein
MSIQETEREAAANATAPRVSLADMESEIAQVIYMNALDAACTTNEPIDTGVADSLRCMTICMVVLKSGFVVTDQSAPASRENFNAELQRKFSYERCIRQLWPMFAFSRMQARLPPQADDAA